MIDNINIIEKYFELTDLQHKQFEALRPLYEEWNAKINVISRKDIDSLYTKHILHSLAIARVCTFDTGAKIMDVGCGGGFPCIPLAILFPEAHFTAVDSIGKKIRVVQAVADAIELKNLTAINARAESIDERFDYVVSRAVTDMNTFSKWIWNKFIANPSQAKGTLPAGILYLKGGDLSEELRQFRSRTTLYEIAEMFKDEFFETKKVVYISR